MARRKKTRFQVVAKAVNEYLKEDKISLNFRGYQETIRSYQRLADHHIAEVYDLMIDCLLWSNYMHEVYSFIHWKKEEALLKQDYYMALRDKKNPLPEVETNINKWKTRARHYQLLEKHLLAQYRFFNKAYEQCKLAYAKGVKELGAFHNPVVQ